MKNIIKKLIVYLLIFCEIFQTTGVFALTKEENVYVKLNESGKVESTSITEHLLDFNEKIVNDKTLLNDIKNINGEEKFDKEGNNLTWETNGKDIYYQGTYNNELPISMNIKYYLDGKEKTVDEILGKKGNIKISMTYENNSYKIMNINGKNEKIYVPYAIVTTTILNNNDNKNIKVINGKVIDNGLNSIVTGVSSPGLYESLKLDELKDLNKVEFSYDTESFELNPIYSVATSNLFEDDNLDKFSNINDLYNSIDLLQNNMNTIVEGSKKLSDGTNQMNKGITELNNRTQQLTNKYNYYRNQDKNTLKEEIIKIIEKNINTITPALEEEITNETSKLIKENKEELEEAVISYTKENTKHVVEEEINRIVSNLDINELVKKTINSNTYNVIKNDEEISNLSNKFNEDINVELNNIVTQELNQLINNIDNNMLNVQEENINYIMENYSLSEEQARNIVTKVQTDTLNQAKKNISETNISNNIDINLINDYINKLNNEIINSLNNNTEITNYSNEIKEKIIAAIEKDLEENNLYLDNNIKDYITEITNRIIDNTAKDLSSKYTEDYTNRVVNNIIEKEFSEENVDSRLREILDIYGNDINKNVSILDNTINTLSISMQELNNGSNQISQGMNTLSNGLDRYNKEGINKINSLVNSDVKTLQKRFAALVELSKNNKTIDSIPTNATGNSKIIFMIDSKSKTNDVKKDITPKETKVTFWDKIKGLFK